MGVTGQFLQLGCGDGGNLVGVVGCGDAGYES